MEQSISEKVKAILENTSLEFSITGRELFNSFGFERRTSGNCWVVDNYLKDNNLMVEPHYNNVWIDTPITLKHKPIARTRIAEDPILRVAVLERANMVPVYVTNCDTLIKAITIMRMNNYSQLPVSNNGLRGLCGYISWKTIGEAQANGVQSDLVRDYVQPIERTLTLETPLLEAIKYVHNNEFAIIEDKTHQICGILTTTDISEQFLLLTEPYLLMQEIENMVRLLLSDVFNLEEIQSICVEPGRSVNSLDDLTFGEYLRIIDNSERWQTLNLNIDRREFVKMLDKVREIRNDIMHFEPDGISPDQYTKLCDAVNFLSSILRNRA